VPLLFEKNMAGFFDRTLVVACCPSLQLERLQRRDRLSVDEAAKRLATQIPIDEKIRLAHEVIRNDGTLEELEAAVDQYLLKIN
jgi:dephospho-CoA kinase